MKGRQAWLSAEMALPTQPGKIEEEGYSCGFRCIAGLDEVGRGPLAGPVVAAAVALPRGLSHPEIRDSKLLTRKKREALAPWIKAHATAWGVGIVGPEVIDRMNILRATFLAMVRALKQLRPVPDYLLIDGPHKIPHSLLVRSLTRYLKSDEYTNNDIPQQKAVRKGDRLCLSIAAASIVAKVTRDEMMIEYDRLYPEYGFGEHKGYGSPLHLAALSRYGPSTIHRRSFRRVRETTNLALSDQQSAFRFGLILADR